MLYLYPSIKRTSFYIINAITFYRLFAALLLLYLIVVNQPGIFRWFLALSFFTDSIDGFLARKYGVVSEMGSRVDSIANDMTVLMAIIGILVFEPGFLTQQLWVVIALTALYLIQLISALARYGKLTSFHTYLSKIAAVTQGVFFILFFFLPQWPVFIFYITASVTSLALLEEIVLVTLLKKWKADIKGLYWILHDRDRES